jgi:hypothetical protein
VRLLADDLPPVELGPTLERPRPEARRGAGSAVRLKERGIRGRGAHLDREARVAPLPQGSESDRGRSGRLPQRSAARRARGGGVPHGEGVVAALFGGLTAVEAGAAARARAVTAVEAGAGAQERPLTAVEAGAGARERPLTAVEAGAGARERPLTAVEGRRTAVVGSLTAVLEPIFARKCRILGEISTRRAPVEGMGALIGTRSAQLVRVAAARAASTRRSQACWSDRALASDTPRSSLLCSMDMQ